MGIKLQFKFAKNPQGAIEYCCKDHNKPHFRAINSNGDTEKNSDVYKNYGLEYDRTNGGAFNDISFLRQDQLTKYIFDMYLAYHPNIQDMGPGNFLLDGIRTKSIALHNSFVAPKANTVSDPDRLCRYLKMLTQPHQTTERDLYIVLFGAKDHLLGGLRRNLPFPDVNGQVNREHVRDPKFYNERYRNKTLAQCLATYSQLQQDAQPCNKLKYADLRPWQQLIVKKIHKPECKNFGRRIRWYHESVGNVGKSVLTKYLIQNYRCVQIRGTTSDGLYAVAEYTNNNGFGPHIIVVDIPRSTETVNYELMEELKNGTFMSGKYASQSIVFDRPHVVVFANRPPDSDCLSADRLEISHIDDVIIEAQCSDLFPPIVNNVTQSDAFSDSSEYNFEESDSDNAGDENDMIQPRKKQKQRLSVASSSDESDSYETAAND